MLTVRMNGSTNLNLVNLLLSMSVSFTLPQCLTIFFSSLFASESNWKFLRPLLDFSKLFFLIADLQIMKPVSHLKIFWGLHINRCCYSNIRQTCSSVHDFCFLFPSTSYCIFVHPMSGCNWVYWTVRLSSICSFFKQNLKDNGSFFIC